MVTVAITASGIQLEATHCSDPTAVAVHIATGLLMAGLVALHVYLHFARGNRLSGIGKLRSRTTRALWWVAVVTFISAIIASAHWLTSLSHSPVGGVHGKIGFVMILLATLHISKRIGFFKR